MMEKKIEYNGVTMAYDVNGQGSDVIIMHGWGCSRSTVKSISDLAAEQHRVFTVDFPGHGTSTEPPLLPDGKPWGVNEFTCLIEQLVNTESIENPILIGHSFGGRVGILYASRNNVDRLVLVDSAGIKPRRPMKYYYKVYSYKLAKWAALTFLGKERGARKVEEMRKKRGSSDYQQASPMMRSVMSRVVNEDLQHVMPQIKCPTLLMWGENDSATPLADAKIMDKLIPDTGLVAFPGCGHFCFLDNPGAFARVLRSFINKTPVQ